VIRIDQAARLEIGLEGGAVAHDIVARRLQGIMVHEGVL
jgi:hypothetical protein